MNNIEFTILMPCLNEEKTMKILVTPISAFQIWNSLPCAFPSFFWQQKGFRILASIRKPSISKYIINKTK